MFYADTALDGNSNYSLECGLAFFGEDHILFGTDMPLMLKRVHTRRRLRGLRRWVLDATKRRSMKTHVDSFTQNVTVLFESAGNNIKMMEVF
jgi:hypothetical protein